MKKLLIPVFIAMLAILVPTVLADGADVTLQKGSLTGYTGETQSLDITVRNTQSKTDTFTLSIFPSQFEKVTTSLESFLLTLGPNENKVVKLYVTVAIDADLLSPTFAITAKSTSDESVSDTENLILIIQRQTPVYIPDLSLAEYTLDPEDDVGISARVFNLEETLSQKTFLKITVRKGTNIVKSFEDSLDSIGAKSSVNIAKSFKLDKYAAPGSYVVDAELRDTSNKLLYSKSINFNVNTINQPPTEYTKKSSSYNVLFSMASIKVKNEGNVELPSFLVTQSLPKFAQTLFDPDIEPVSTQSSNNRVVYTWSVPALAPGAQYTVAYKIALWRIWLTVGIIGGTAYFAYKWLSTPRIHKAIRHEGEIKRGKDVLILLEVKNRALHELKNVEVVDVVPGIARVVDKFDTLRPKARRVPNGIELKWTFDSMKSGEERVITYRIRPAVDVMGHFSLPEAQMIFLDRNKVRRFHISKQALYKAI